MWVWLKIIDPKKLNGWIYQSKTTLSRILVFCVLEADNIPKDPNLTNRWAIWAIWIHLGHWHLIFWAMNVHICTLKQRQMRNLCALRRSHGTGRIYFYRAADHVSGSDHVKDALWEVLLLLLLVVFLYMKRSLVLWFDFECCNSEVQFLLFFLCLPFGINFGVLNVLRLPVFHQGQVMLSTFQNYTISY